MLLQFPARGERKELLWAFIRSTIQHPKEYGKYFISWKFHSSFPQLPTNLRHDAWPHLPNKIFNHKDLDTAPINNNSFLSEFIATHYYL